MLDAPRRTLSASFNKTISPIFVDIRLCKNYRMANQSNAAKKAWKTRRTVGTIETEVLAHLPLTVDLTRRTSGRTLTFEIKSGGVLLGTLHMGRGSVQWFATKAKKPGEWTWTAFAKMLGGK